MTTQISICSICGSTDIKDHYYKHDLKLIYIDKTDTSYIIDASLFDTYEIDGKCTFPDCNASKKLHDKKTGLIKHDFLSNKIIKRNINFILPSDTKCNICNISIKHHHNMDLYMSPTIQFHYFKYNIEILNKTDNDTINIYDTNNKLLKI